MYILICVSLCRSAVRRYVALSGVLCIILQISLGE